MESSWINITGIIKETKKTRKNRSLKIRNSRRKGNRKIKLKGISNKCELFQRASDLSKARLFI